MTMIDEYSQLPFEERSTMPIKGETTDFSNQELELVKGVACLVALVIVSLCTLCTILFFGSVYLLQ